MKPLDLIKTARRLTGQKTQRRPRQSDLKRAASTAYYAMFHTLCQNCADLLIGRTKANRSQPAWRQAYRAVDHGFSKNQCKNKVMLSKFPKDIEDFGNLFVDLQEKRHAADYYPFSVFLQSDVIISIDAAELAITKLNAASAKDRRAFAAWTVMKSRSD